jgi:hypothetical protein
MMELEEQCTEEDWEKTSEGSAGTGEYTWDPRPEGSSPMIRIGAGLGTGVSQTHVDGQLTVRHEGTDRDIDYLSYSGLTVKLEGVAGYFLHRDLAVHGGLNFYSIPSPTAEIELQPDDIIPAGAETVGRGPADIPQNTTFGMLTAGVTGYTPGEIFISGSAGLGVGAVEDPVEDYNVVAGPGFGFNIVIGKDFQVDELFGFGFGGYLDVVVQPTDADYTITHVTLGLQSHGILRFR